MCRNMINLLYRAVVSYKLVLDIGCPQVELDEVSHQMLINAYELSSKHPPCIDISSEWLKTLIVSKNLRG